MFKDQCLASKGFPLILRGTYFGVPPAITFHFKVVIKDILVEVRKRRRKEEMRYYYQWQPDRNHKRVQTKWPRHQDQ